MTYDRRQEFEFEFWQQGSLLLTPTTQRWSAEQRRAAHAEERLCAFAFFTPLDQGRGRAFVFKFDTAEACAEAVAQHNLALRRMHPEVLAALQKSKRPPIIEHLKPAPWTWD